MNLNIEIIKGWIREKSGLSDPCMKKVIIVGIVSAIVSAWIF